MTLTTDLGPLDGRVLVGGGAYGNLQALEAFDRLAGGLGIPPGNVIHNGDIAAYCADADACSDLARTRGWASIKGNVEAQLAAGAQDCACGFAAGGVCDTLAARWYAHIDRTLQPRNRAWMANLPDHLRFTLAGKAFTVVHGSPLKTNRFMFASLAMDDFSAELDAAGGDAVIAGHSGIPFTRLIGRRAWTNPGAIGMPANDGTRRVWALLLEPRDGGIRFSHLAFNYDCRAAAARMRACHLPEGYADALETGLWPSLDILPATERKRTGTALALTDTHWLATVTQAAE